MLHAEAHNTLEELQPWPEDGSDNCLVNSEPVRASQHTHFADDADVDMAQAEPTPAEQLEQAQAAPAPVAPAPIAPAQITPAAAAQAVAPEPYCQHL